MLACVDVDYRNAQAVAACLLFESWLDETETQQVVCSILEVAPYVPGEFYKRELPCILKVLEAVPIRPQLLVIDGYVWLAENRKGLGAHLYESLDQKIPIIGVAKTNFHDAPAVPVLRGDSKNPLLVTAVGIAPQVAGGYVKKMHGDFRLPTLLKKVDSLCRTARLTQSVVS
jgi:deoxyribonuclease V